MSEDAKPVCDWCGLAVTSGGVPDMPPFGHAPARHLDPGRCITALRAALDQRRAECTKLRDFIQAEYYKEWTSETDAEAFCERIYAAGMVDAGGHPTALLSGKES